MGRGISQATSLLDTIKSNLHIFQILQAKRLTVPVPRAPINNAVAIGMIPVFHIKFSSQQLHPGISLQFLSTLTAAEVTAAEVTVAEVTAVAVVEAGRVM